MFVHHMYAWHLRSQKGALRFPGTGLWMVVSHPTSVTRNRTWVLWNSSSRGNFLRVPLASDDGFAALHEAEERKGSRLTCFRTAAAALPPRAHWGGHGEVSHSRGTGTAPKSDARSGACSCPGDSQRSAPVRKAGLPKPLSSGLYSLCASTRSICMLYGTRGSGSSEKKLFMAPATVFTVKSFSARSRLWSESKSRSEAGSTI